MRFNRRILGKTLLAGSAVLFALSLGFQCFYSEGETPDWSFGSQEGPGFLLLMIGWLGLIEHEYAWLANPCYALAMICALSIIKKFSKSETSSTNPDYDSVLAFMFSMKFSIAATLLSLSFLLQSSTMMGPGPAGTLSRIEGYCPGYFLWCASMVVQLVGVAVLPVRLTRTDD